MNPKLVTFDCAGTLVGIPPDWTLGQFAGDCAKDLGLELAAGDCDRYQNMYAGRLGEFVAVNMSRDANERESFWNRLAADWLVEIGQPVQMAPEIQKSAKRLGFGPSSSIFTLFDDVIPTLDKLDDLGISLAVVSNWDYSLHDVLKVFGIYERFVVVKASLEEGVEKPDPLFFQLTLEAAGFSPAETFHVGDDRVDDWDGAKNIGIRAALIDRSLSKSERPFIRSLNDLPEAFAWTD